MDTTLLTTIFSLGIVGVIVSIMAQWIKAKFGSKPTEAKLIVVVLSLIGGTVYYLYSGTAIFLAFVEVLGIASTIWALIIKGTGLFSSSDSSQQ